MTTLIYTGHLLCAKAGGASRPSRAHKEAGSMSGDLSGITDSIINSVCDQVATLGLLPHF